MVMRNLLIATFGLALLGQASIASAATPQASAATPQRACAAPLNDLADEWNTIGFAPPAKPQQAYVSGRHGYRTSGIEFAYMVSQIRLASRDCRAGREGAALARIEQVQRLLAKAGGDVRLGPPVFGAPRGATAPSNPPASPALGGEAHPASSEVGS
jgi:hypothetical protein